MPELYVSACQRSTCFPHRYKRIPIDADLQNAPIPPLGRHGLDDRLPWGPQKSKPTHGSAYTAIAPRGVALSIGAITAPCFGSVSVARGASLRRALARARDATTCSTPLGAKKNGLRRFFYLAPRGVALQSRTSCPRLPGRLRPSRRIIRRAPYRAHRIARSGYGTPFRLP